MRPKPRLSSEIIQDLKTMLGKCPLCGFVRRLVKR